MRFEKERLEKSVNALMDKAEDCFDLAKTQHKSADQQHDIADKQNKLAQEQHENANRLGTSADKLDTVGQALEDEAISLKGELEMDAVRNSPPPSVAVGRRSTQSGSIPKAIESIPKVVPK